MKTQIIPPAVTFRDVLRSNLRSYVRTAKADGTTGMSVDCLKQCVRPPSENFDGAPRGTNAQYFYSQLFREVCGEREFASFIIA